MECSSGTDYVLKMGGANRRRNVDKTQGFFRLVSGDGEQFIKFPLDNEFEVTKKHQV